MSFNANANYSVDFRGSMNVGGSGSIESPWFDTESANFRSAWANYTASVNTPSGTSITWQFKTANTATTYSDATAYTSSISSLTGRFLRLKAVITKNDTYGISSGAVIDSFSPYATPQGSAIMIEESTTNLALRSQEFDNASWAKTTSSVLGNCAIAPDGTATADKLIEDTSASTVHLVRQSALLTISSPGTFSVYAKAGERNWLYIYNGTTVAYFNVQTGAVGSISSANGWTSAIKYVGNGWYRCSITHATSVASVSFDDFNIGVANADLGSTYTGDGISGIYLWGAQAEVKAYPTSYVPTTSGTATRNADVLSIPSANTFSNINSGSIISRVKLDSLNPSNLQMVVDIGGTGASGCYLTVYLDGSIRFTYGTMNGGSATVISTGMVVPGVWSTISVKWGQTGVKIFSDGVLRTEYTTGTYQPNIIAGAGLGAIYIGNNAGSLRFLNGLMSDCVLYNGELTDAEMLAYTASGAVIPLDYRTAYKLDFENNLLHGEGGSRITTGVALDNIGAITNSTIAWTETENASASGAISFSQSTGVALSGSSLTKNTGVSQWGDSGAFSKEIINSGENAYVSFTTAETTTSKIIGFSTSNSGNDQLEIKYGIKLTTIGNYEVQESGTNRGVVSTYSSGDIFRIDCIDGAVRYYKNGTLVYTSTVTNSTYPLYVDCALYSSAATLNNIGIGYYSKIDLDTSVDNGTTWVAATNGGAISSIGATGVGKTLKIRQKLTTPRSATSPSLNDMTVNIFGTAASGQGTTAITPVFTKLALAPTNVSKWQLEAKSYATSFVSGTRNAETLTTPGSVINPTSGTVIIRAYFNNINSSASTRQFVLFDTTGTAGVNRYLIRKADSSTTFGAYINQNSSINQSMTFSEGWHTIGMRWSSARISVYVDGTEIAYNATPTINSTVPTTAYIGVSSADTSQCWDAPISDCVIYNESMSDAEMVSYTSSGSVLPLDHRTTYKLDFESNLLHGEGGYRISPSTTLTAVRDIAGSNVSWTETETSGAVQDFTFSQSYNCTVSNGNDIRKTGGTAGVFDATFVGNRKFEFGENFCVQWKSGETTGYKSVGLTSDLTRLSSANQASLDYQIYMEEGGTIDARKLSSTTLSNNVTTFTSSDIIRLECIDSVVKLYKNSTLLYTFDYAVTGALYFAGSIYTASGTINDCQYALYPEVNVDVSADAGSTWTNISSSGSIAALTNGDATGKTVMTRQRLTTPRSATSPSVQDVTIKIAQTQTTDSTYITPLTTKLVLTPSNLNRWQLENKQTRTSFANTTRVVESMLVPSGALLNTAGSIVTRFYVREDQLNGTTGSENLYLFDTAGTIFNNRINVEKSVAAGTVSIYAGTAGNIYSGDLFDTSGWHSLAVIWGDNEISIYYDGSEVASATGGMTSPMTSTMKIGHGTLSSWNWNAPIADFICFREKLTDAEVIAYTAASGAVIPNDYRVSYRLDFDNAITHIENGNRVTPSYALDVIPSITSSTVSWTETLGSSGTIEVYSSIDGGDNWSVVTNGGSVSGIVGSGVGKELMFKQVFYSADAYSNNPSIDSFTVRIEQEADSDFSYMLTPVFGEVTFTPTDVTKWQVEGNVFSTSFTDATRNAETLTFPTTEVIKAAGGSVIVRAYVSDDAGNSSASGQHYLFDAAVGANADRVSLYRDTDSWKAQIISTSGVVSVATGSVVSDGIHTFGFNWIDDTIQLWVDGSMASSGAATMISNIPATGYIGSDYAGLNQHNYQIMQFDLFTEGLTVAEMTEYTASSGAVFALTHKHAYRMKFEDNLKYGTAGVFYSRFHDAGSSTTGTPWVTYTKSDVVPSGTSVIYKFAANDTGTNPESLTYGDITEAEGRFIKAKIALCSEDAANLSPTVTALRMIPRYS